MEGALIVLIQHPLSPKPIQLAFLLLQPHHRALVDITLVPAELPSDHQALLVQRWLECRLVDMFRMASFIFVELED